MKLHAVWADKLYEVRGFLQCQSVSSTGRKTNKGLNLILQPLPGRAAEPKKLNRTALGVWESESSAAALLKHRLGYMPKILTW